MRKLLLNRYEVEGEIGQGNFGRILLATDTQTDKQVAIKELICNDAVRQQRICA